GALVVRVDRRDVAGWIDRRARHAAAVGEVAHRIALRIVDPAAAEVDRESADVACPQSSADAIARFEDHAVDAGVAQRIRGGESGHAGTDDDDATDRPRDAARAG